MEYYILEKNNEYLKRVSENVFEVTEHLHLAYKFNSKESALMFKELSKVLGDFKIFKCNRF